MCLYVCVGIYTCTLGMRHRRLLLVLELKSKVVKGHAARHLSQLIGLHAVNSADHFLHKYICACGTVQL